MYYSFLSSAIELLFPLYTQSTTQEFKRVLHVCIHVEEEVEEDRLEHYVCHCGRTRREALTGTL